MTWKITAHTFERIPDWLEDYCQRAGVSWVKAIGTFPDFPGINTIARVYIDDALSNELVLAQARGADEWWNGSERVGSLREIVRKNPHVLWWEGANEVPIWIDEYLHASPGFWARLADLYHSEGRKLVGGSFNTNWPVQWQMPWIKRIMDHVDALGLHEYSPRKTLWGGDGSDMLHYRLVRKWGEELGARRIPYMITEFNIDRVVSGKHLSWTDLDVSEEELAVQFKWYGEELAKDDYVVCATAYGVEPNPDWINFGVPKDVFYKAAGVPVEPPRPPRDERDKKRK